MGPSLVLAIMRAMLCRMSGLREITGQCSGLLGTFNFSSLAPALCRASGISLLMTLIASLESRCEYIKGELVALDSMALVIAKTRRHKCAKFNDKAVGGGVLWSYRVKATTGTCPVKLLKLIRGSWSDSTFMRKLALIPELPIYLMDRGFYSIENIGRWLRDKVRFIIRVKASRLTYEVVRHLSQGCPLSNGWRFELDAIVTLGSPKRKSPRPQVRLIIAYNSKGEQFIFATSEDEKSKTTQQVIDDYKQRWHIERFHRFLKDTLGLAHTYSFSATGLEFMILTALLTAMLLFFSVDPNDDRETILLLFAALKQVRQQLGIPPLWRRNILAKKRSGGKKKKIK